MSNFGHITHLGLGGGAAGIAVGELSGLVLGVELVRLSRADDGPGEGHGHLGGGGADASCQNDLEREQDGAPPLSKSMSFISNFFTIFSSYPTAKRCRIVEQLTDSAVYISPYFLDVWSYSQFPQQ